MPSYDIAHLHEQGQDMIIVPVDSKFGSLQKREQDLFVTDFQGHCVSAGLRGIVVPVWLDSFRRFCFLAPPAWHSFLLSIDMSFVVGNINKKIDW